ncbi:MAG: phosphatase PAP2 family protein [Dysosmobacter sp.]
MDLTGGDPAGDPQNQKAGSLRMACGLVLDLLFCNLALKPLIGRMRPFAVSPGVSPADPAPTDASFPSGHTAASFASVAALKTANSRLWKPALALAVVIALSRLYLYAHWPTDILGALPWVFWQVGWEQSWRSQFPGKSVKRPGNI